MKILMIAPEPFFEPRGTPFSVLGRLKALSALGHEIDLLTYHLGQDVTISNVRIYRTVRIPPITKIRIGPSLIKLFLDLLLMAKTVQFLLLRKYDLLHAHEEASFFTIFLARLFGIPHLYDMHSSLPQQLRNFEYTKFSPVIRIFEWFERYVISSSEGIITICPALEKHMKNINPHAKHVMIENVPTEVNHEAISQRRSRVEKFRSTYSLDGKMIVLYAGTFEPYQGLDLLIRSAERVIAKAKNILFLLIGGHPDQVKKCRTLVEQLGLASQFCFTGIRPPDEIPIAIEASDVLISPRISGTNTPLKIYAYLQSGKPIIATNLYTHTQILTSEVALLVEPEAGAMAAGIITLLEDVELSCRLGKQASQLFKERYSFETYLRNTELILQMSLR